MKNQKMKLTNIGMMGYNMLSDEDLEMLLAQEKEMIDKGLLSQENYNS